MSRIPKPKIPGYLYKEGWQDKPSGIKLKGRIFKCHCGNDVFDTNKNETKLLCTNCRTTYNYT